MSTSCLYVALVLAAGLGTRLGRGLPKALVTVRGYPVLYWTLQNLARWGHWERWVIVFPPGWEDSILHAITLALPHQSNARLVPGGERRQDSVLAGLRALQDLDREFPVMVHDAARPLVTEALLERLHQAYLAGAQGVIPVLPLSDTVKVLDEMGTCRTLKRDDLRVSQTPQLALLGLLNKALQAVEASGVSVTDEAQALELSGYSVKTIMGDPWNRKITTPWDLKWLEWALEHWTETH